MSVVEIQDPSGPRAAVALRAARLPLIRALVAILAASIGIAAVAAPEDIPAGTFKLDTDETQHVNLQANQAPLADILAEMGAQLGIEIKGSSPGNTPVTAQFADLALPDALKRIMDNYMSVTDDATGRVAKIILLPKGDGTRYIPPVQAAPVQPPESEVIPASGIDFDPDAAADDASQAPEAEDASEAWESEMT